MKIMINRQPRKHAWGGGTHFVTSLSEHLVCEGIDVTHTLEPNIDLIVMIDPRPETGGDDINYLYDYKLKNPKCKIVHRVNDTDIARGTDFLDKINIDSNAITDYTVFISSWVKDYYVKKGMKVDDKKNSVIINGCNENWYYPKEENTLSQDKIKIVTHHWSDNFMKGFDVYNYLDNLCAQRKDIEFTYMGRYNKQYVPKNTKIIPPCYGSEIGQNLRQHDIYLTAARWEACGMHHIEGSASGLPVLYHKDGGAIPEICKSHGVEFQCHESFTEGLQQIIDNYSMYREKIDYEHLGMKRCLRQYTDVINEILEKR